MAATVTDFLARFPEFAPVNSRVPVLVAASLDTAIAHVDKVRWGKQWESGVMYYCAHLLSLSPNGGSARLNQYSTDTTYGLAFQDLQRTLPVRMLVL